ncbi:MAG: type II secretion system major pseudopilin GspG [Desulfobacterales bacterium]
MLKLFTFMGNRRFFSSRAGFTLIELMVVIVILSILAVYMMPKIMGRPEQARRIKAKTDIQALETALRLYKLDNGKYPTTEQGLEALVREPDSGPEPMNWREGGYVEKGRITKDPWGNEYEYICPGNHGDYDIISYGADGEPGGDGDDADIKSWEIE